jgi:hypothetical protein
VLTVSVWLKVSRLPHARPAPVKPSSDQRGRGLPPELDLGHGGVVVLVAHGGNAPQVDEGFGKERNVAARGLHVAAQCEDERLAHRNPVKAPQVDLLVARRAS